MAKFVQTDFSGGMNLFNDDTNIAENQYAVSFNVRNRSSGLSTIKSPIVDTTLPNGKKQGIYGFDKYIIAFVGGSAYYKDITIAGPWTKIADFVLSPTVDYIYAQLVPASSSDFKRSLISDDQINGSQTTIVLKKEIFTSTGSLSGLVVQDGVNTPWFILQNGTARRLQRYQDWSLTGDRREYVPIMKQMIYTDGILFGMSPDGKKLYRSVSGRPLDFVVNVTTTGDKGGDATTTEYSIGFNTVNCLNTNTDGNLLLGTDKYIVILSLNFQATIFAEPTFTVEKEYAIGIVNNFSFVKYSDSYHFMVDSDGIRTFSANQETDVNENRNSIFTSMISGAVTDANEQPIKQTLSAVISFNDYTIFSVKTSYSDTINYLAIYDNLRQQWVSIDKVDESIKMFAVADQSQFPILYGISDTKIYKFFSGNTALANASFKGFNSGTASINQKLDAFNTVFYKGTVPSSVTTTEYEDGVRGNSVRQQLSGRTIETLRFNYQSLAGQCWKSQPVIEWQNDSRLVALEVNTTAQTSITSAQQQAKVYEN